MILSVFTDEFFMKEALKEALKANALDEIPIGAVVVSKGKIIARAHNLTEQLRDVTAHAEMLAITAAANHLGGKYLEECTLFVTLEPCVMCAGAIHLAHFERVVWAADDEKRGFNTYNSSILHPKTTFSKGLMADESKQLLQEFFRKKR